MISDINEATPLNPSEQESSYRSVSTDTLSQRNTDDEENVLPPTASDENESGHPLVNIVTIVSVLLLGEFISNADGTLVMAAAAKISSEFRHLQHASWLSTAYTLGVCASQPMYGKLSDIYGRKPLLLAAYALFGVGCIISGLGPGFWMVIGGRALSGVGGAGIMTMGSVIITDIVPRREVATWRAYINIAMTLGRSVGGPVGGLLTDVIGWRNLFLLQAPLIGIAALLVVAKLRTAYRDETKAPAIGRVDFLGTALLAVSIVSSVVLIDRGGHAFPWISWQSLMLGSAGILFLAAFVWVEKSVAPEPIFDLRILRHNVPVNYMISCLQITAQLGIMFSVPLYFQVTQRASTTAAGGHMVPAVIGNTLGGLLAGKIIRTTGQYKNLLIIAGLVAATSYILLLMRWNGQSQFALWESLDIFPGGMGTGIASAAGFVSMTSLLEPQEIAMATGGYMLIGSFAMGTGVTVTNTVLGLGFKRQLEKNLHVPDAQTIIRRATSDTSYIGQLEGKVRETVVECYVAGLKNTYVISLVCSLLGSLLGWAVRQDQL